MTKRAILVLEDGSVYEGYSFSAEASTYGEAVCNISMTGYQEVNSVVNTITGGRIPLRDGFQLHRAEEEKRIPYFTALDTACAAVEALVNGSQIYSAQSLPDYRTKEPA